MAHDCATTFSNVEENYICADVFLNCGTIIGYFIMLKISNFI